jgi:SpoVK/Ycf46/Vps4 family AAA+-type ATPase
MGHLCKNLPNLEKKITGSPKAASPKHVVKVANSKYAKPSSPEDLPLLEINIQTKVADVAYLTELKKTIADIESSGYNIKSLDKDINDDEFIKKALDGHIQALQFKLKTYKKLGEVNWQGDGPADGRAAVFSVNLNSIIKKMEDEITTKLKMLKSNPNAIAQKRKELLSILYDPDNGIATIRGSTRESVRISMMKLIYMFIKVPVFFFKGFINFMLTGPAGSGKTKIASVVAHMMKNLGILASTKVIMATKQNLVAEFNGQSGPKTRNLLAGALEGVVFIDEAYTLTPCPGSAASSSDTYSEESVGELINFMDKFIGCLVVIVAGYKNKMYECFLKFNEGMSRRFPKIIDLVNYNSNDMYNIFETFLSETLDVKKILTKTQRIFIKSIITKLNNNDIFNNQAGDMLNLSKVIGEDAVLFTSDYDDKMIKLSFMKFCANKNIALEF